MLSLSGTFTVFLVLVIKGIIKFIANYYSTDFSKANLDSSLNIITNLVSTSLARSLLISNFSTKVFLLSNSLD